MIINAKTSVYCIIGNPVRHSLSPIMHNAAFTSIGMNAVYVAFEPSTIKDAFNAIKALCIKGASVTIPFKVDVLPLCDSVDDLSLRIGSVNTLVNDEGKIKGYNTDGYGLRKSLETHAIDYHNKKILIIGNGGSARAIAYTLAQHDAQITICGRNINNIMQLGNDLRKHFDAVDTMLLEQLTPDITAQYHILINTTPVGMKPDISQTPIDTALLYPHHVVVDIIYTPLQTLLIQKARSQGCTVITGDYMLLYQACMQFEIWTNKAAPIDVMHQALKQALQ